MKASNRLTFYGILLICVSIFMIVIGTRHEDLLLQVIGYFEVVIGIVLLIASRRKMW